MAYHDHGLRSVQERFLLLDHKPGINYLLTFETLPHTRLLNTILKRFYLILRTDFRYHHTVFVRFYCYILGVVFLVVKRCRSGL